MVDKQFEEGKSTIDNKRTNDWVEQTDTESEIEQHEQSQQIQGERHWTERTDTER